MRIELYRYEVQKAAEKIGLTINDLEAQEFILQYHGQIETDLSKIVNYNVLPNLLKKYFKKGDDNGTT